MLKRGFFIQINGQLSARTTNCDAHKKAAIQAAVLNREFGRGERIRTFDFYLPKVALYQAELHPDSFSRGLLQPREVSHYSEAAEKTQSEGL